MAFTGWRYIAVAYDGAGGQEIVHQDLPLSGVQITDTISGPPGLTGTIDPEIATARDASGKRLLKEWGTGIFAECDGVIRGGGLLSGSSFTGSQWQLACVGLSGYPKDQPYTDSRYWVLSDPLDIYRHIWRWLQSQPDGNLGLTVDDTSSPVVYGTQLTGDQYDANNPGTDPTLQANAYRLSWYETPDLGQSIDDLAEAVPFDWHERSYWDDEYTAVRTHIDIGYPTMSRRLTDIVFEVGINVYEDPSTSLAGDDYATGVLALGAGEGRTMLHQLQYKHQPGRLRRVKVVDNKDLRKQDLLSSWANKQLAIASSLRTLSEVTVINHPNAPYGSYRVGDEILVRNRIGWDTYGEWCRILSTTISPDTNDNVSVTIAPVSMIEKPTPLKPLVVLPKLDPKNPLPGGQLPGGVDGFPAGNSSPTRTTPTPKKTNPGGQLPGGVS